MKRPGFIASLIVSTALLFSQLASGTAFAADVIAHGAGDFEGYTTTNSVEALEASIAAGYKLIELDMDLSADGEIIMIHDWDRTAEHYFGQTFDKKLRRSEFEELKINGRFTPLTFDRLMEILDEADRDPATAGVRIVTDTKGSNTDLLKAIAKKYPYSKNRIIPQIYSYGEFGYAKLMGFPDVILTTYRMDVATEQPVIDFVKNNGLYALTVSAGHEELWRAAARQGVKTYCHPVDTFEEAEALLEEGVAGVYSGVLLKEDFDEPTRSYYIMMPADGQESASGGAGGWVKLTDCLIPGEAGVAAATKDIVALPVNGLKQNEYRIYTLDGARLNDEVLKNASYGTHDLTVEIYALDANGVGHPAGITAGAILRKGTDGLRLFDARYLYRADRPAESVPFAELAEEAALKKNIRVSDEQYEILANSFIVMAGESFYYDRGEEKRFMVGSDYIEPQKSATGKTLIPLADAAKILGGSAAMDKDRQLVITGTDTAQTYAAPGSYSARRGDQTAYFDSPAVIFRNKAEVCAELLAFALNRKYIERDSICIFVPDGVQLSPRDQEILPLAAKGIFETAAADK